MAQYKRPRQLLISALVGATTLIAPLAHAGTKDQHHKQAALRKAKEEARAAFMNFIVDFLRWSAKAYSKIGEGEAREEIYFKFTSEEFQRLKDFFEGNRQLLHDLSRQNDLYQVHGQELIPQELYTFIKLNFSLKSLNDPIDINLFLQKMVGCSCSSERKPKHLSRAGFLDKVIEYNLSEWRPIHHFIDQFKDTLTLDARVASNLGRVLLPLLKHYFNYMDTVSRLRLFKELIEDWQNLELTGDRDHDLEVIAIKIFQNTGPVLIKFLQQLQEEVSGETPISKVLEGLKHSKPMHPATAEEISRREFAAIYNHRKLSSFGFKEEPLGIASIAQTHKITFDGNTYVIKILKARVQEVFEREKAILNRLLSDEKNTEEFDKGLKQSIANMISGIAEEMDLAHEMANIAMGHTVYTNSAAGIQTVAIPDLRNLKETAREIKNKDNAAVIMTLAPGEPLGKVMRHGSESELKIAYTLVQNLYRDYLLKALVGSNGMHFYHGDLHRENIFIDLKPALGQPYLTLIDFGNAGTINPAFRSSIIQIMQSTRDTNTSMERHINKHIERLGHSLHAFVLGESLGRAQDKSTTRALINEYFASCFNPNGTVEQKMLASQAINNQKEDMLVQRKHLLEEMAAHPEKARDYQHKLLELTENIDFSNALLFNCLNGSTNKLLTTLAEPNSVSEKLIVVFQELEKNGISLPRDVIFFNKSKALLEGILTNIAQKLDSLHATYSYVEPETIFDQIVKKLKL